MARKPVAKIGKYSLGKLKSRKQWCVQWRDGTKRPRHILHVGLDRPQREAEAALALWVRGIEAAASQDSKITIAQIMEAYIENRRKEGKRIETMRYNWKALQPTFAHLQPSDLTTVVVVEGEERTRCHEYALARYEAGIARDTISTELNRLRTAIAWAARQNLIDRAPFVWVPPPGSPRDVVLDESELAAFFRELKMPHVRLTVLIALCTGARKTAIRELRWPQVDLDRRTINFRKDERRSILDSSHKKGRAIVDMNDWLYAEMLYAYEWRQTDYVVEYKGKSAGDVKKAVARAVKRAGLGGRRIGLHTLRHTLATWAADKGVDMRKIQRILGHDQLKTTDKIYAKHRRGYTREVADVANLRVVEVDANPANRALNGGQNGRKGLRNLIERM